MKDKRSLYELYEYSTEKKTLYISLSDNWLFCDYS